MQDRMVRLGSGVSPDQLLALRHSQLTPKEMCMSETIWRGFLMFVWTLFAGSALAATTPPADTLKVDYFSNANTSGAPDATVRLTNPGTAAGNTCGSIFVFDENQELTECCSCLLTPDGLRTLSVNVDLTSHPLTGVILATG